MFQSSDLAERGTAGKISSLFLKSTST